MMYPCTHYNLKWGDAPGVVAVSKRNTSVSVGVPSFTALRRCVCVRERECVRGRECVCVCERETVCVCVCVCVR